MCDPTSNASSHSPRRHSRRVFASSRPFATRTGPPLTAFIDTHRGQFGVEAICRTPTCAGIPVAASTYYACRTRPPSQRALRDEKLTRQIRRIHEANYGVYGARKVWHQLRREGVQVARCTVERLMRQEGLVGATRGRRIRTTVPGKDGRRAGDLVNRDFHPAGPDRTQRPGRPHVTLHGVDGRKRRVAHRC
ncbi:IS3 family transposase [Streptacidiphilus carbonis]|uniref:IS3 family transposase n=1 Tax=Streptacidiphilus carbonis TaxID=105422 RepID=UPI0007C7702B|nr:IS3 family transposase [Streptacidiphilus carbonis]